MPLNPALTRGITRGLNPSIIRAAAGGAAAIGIDRVEVELITGSSSTDPFVYTMPADLDVGDVVIAFCGMNGGAAFYYLLEDTTTDWTYDANLSFFSASAFANGTMRYRVIDGTEQATYGFVTANANTKNYHMFFVVIKGVDTTTPLAVTPTTAHRGAVQNDSTPPVKDITGQAEGDLVISFIYHTIASEITAFVAPTGFTIMASDLALADGRDYAIAQLVSDGSPITGLNWDNTVSASAGEHYTCTIALKAAA